jgi:hypothetical protein
MKRATGFRACFNSGQFLEQRRNNHASCWFTRTLSGNRQCSSGSGKPRRGETAFYMNTPRLPAPPARRPGEPGGLKNTSPPSITTVISSNNRGSEPAHGIIFFRQYGNVSCLTSSSRSTRKLSATRLTGLFPTASAAATTVTVTTTANPGAFPLWRDESATPFRNPPHRCEGTPVDRQNPQPFQCIKVCLAWIALVAGKAVARIGLVQCQHFPVPGHLGQD